MPTVPYRDRMRASMIAIASRIVREEGLAAVQARRIAQESGCAVGTLYNVFGGLDLLIIEANAITLGELGDALTQADLAASEGGLSDRLVALALAYLSFAHAHSAAWRAVFEHHMTPGTPVPEWYRERQNSLFAVVARALPDDFTDAASRGGAAKALFSAVHGIVTIALDQKLGEFDLADTDRQVQFVVRSIAAGLSRGTHG